MNFTGVYDYEPFSHNKKFTWLDCTHLQGVECYCDKEGAHALKRVIANYPADGIHFIDSGNYHYLTKFWTDKIQQPFSLIVFDHHPDMQPSCRRNDFVRKLGRRYNRIEPLFTQSNYHRSIRKPNQACFS